MFTYWYNHKNYTDGAYCFLFLFMTLVSLELAKEIFSSYLHWWGCFPLQILVPPYINISPATFELYWILLNAKQYYR